MNNNNILNDNIIQRDLQRYQRKGYGLLFAFIIAVFFFTIFPNFILYPIFSSLQEKQPYQIQQIILISTHIICFIICYIVMYIIYQVKLPFFERYRTRKNKWPWEEDNAQWQTKKIEVIKSVVLNMIIGEILCILDSWYSELLRSDLQSFPTLWEMIWQIIFSMIIEDTCFYWIHRTLHHPKLYGLYHKKHHEFYTTVAYASIYAHPFEHVFSNIIPVTLGAKLLGQKMHLVTFQLWLMIRIGDTIDGHSGYEFSWSPYRLLPFSSSAEFHNYHHSHNIGNYESFFSIWDTLMGTNKSFNQFIDQKYLK